jgi:hypothetical protein
MITKFIIPHKKTQPNSNKQPPPPKTSQKNDMNVTGLTPTFFGSLLQGFGLGVGSSIGHKTVDIMLPNGASRLEPKVPTGCETPSAVSSCVPTETKIKCSDELQLHIDCLRNELNGFNDFQYCDQVMENYFECMNPKKKTW